MQNESVSVLGSRGTEAGDDYDHSSFIGRAQHGVARCGRTCCATAGCLPSSGMSTALTTVKGAGYVRIMVDGETVARSPTIARITAQLECERTQSHVDIVDPVWYILLG